MGAWSLWWHVVNLGMPAMVMAVVLSSAAVGLPWRRRLWAPWIRCWGLLSLLGLLVLWGGLWLFGRDGKLMAYGALVLAMGSAAWAVSRWR